MGYHGWIWASKGSSGYCLVAVMFARFLEGVTFITQLCWGLFCFRRVFLLCSLTKNSCQAACKPGSVRILRWWTAIPLGRASQRASTRPTRATGRECPCVCSVGNAAGRPYSVLLPVGFTLPPLLPGARCAFTAPFHPCLPGLRRAGGLFSVALSLGSPPPAVSRHRIPVEPGLSSAIRCRVTAAVQPPDGAGFARWGGLRQSGAGLRGRRFGRRWWRWGAWPDGSLRRRLSFRRADTAPALGEPSYAVDLAVSPIAAMTPASRARVAASASPVTAPGSQ